MKPRTLPRSPLAALLCGASLLLSAPHATRAGDQNDSPVLANDPGADIGDVFVFLDPTVANDPDPNVLDNRQVVLIATVHPFIVPGQMTELAAFDDLVRYRFEIYNDHVNLASPVLDDTAKPSEKRAYIAKVKPKLTIEVAFSKRQVGLEAQPSTGANPIPTNLRRPKLQTATLTFTGFKDAAGKPLINKGRFPAPDGAPLTVTPAKLSGPALDPVVQDVGVAPGQIVKFFAGVVDDPFYFDVPAFTAFIDGVRNGGAPTVSAFSRQRDTFAGYNTLAIALRIPVTLLRGVGTRIGVDFLTLRHRAEHFSSKGQKGTGTFATVDRMGHPLVNSFLVPFDLRDLYNAASAKADVSLTFADEIAETLSELGVDTNTPEESFTKFTDWFVAKGDLLQLDLAISNFNSPAGVGYPNGRRVQDDTVDTFLTTLNHGMTVSDGVANGGALPTSFPFLGKPNQPLANGATDPTQN